MSKPQVIIDLEEYNRLLELEKQIPIINDPGETRLLLDPTVGINEVKLVYSYRSKNFEIGVLRSSYPLNDLKKYFSIKIERKDAKL